MVMSNHTGPRTSFAGTAVVGLLALGAWLATPLWACPPESSTSSGSAPLAQGGGGSGSTTIIAAPRAARAARAPRVAGMPAPPAPPTPPTPPTPPAMSDQSTFERYMTERQAEAGARGQGFGGAAGGQGNLEQRIHELESRLDRMTEQLEQLSNQRGSPQSRNRTPAPTIMRVPGAVGFAGSVEASSLALVQDGPTIERVYRLPDGKLEAFTELMARSDVPVLVQRMSDGIKVHATPQQHEVLGQFIIMINPGQKQEGALTLDQGVFRARAHADEATTEAMRKAQVELKAARKQFSGQAETLRKQSREIQERQRVLERKAEELRNKAESTRSQAENAQDVARIAIEEQAQTFEEQANEVELAANDLENQADTIESAADDMADQADQAVASDDDEDESDSN
jgi:hypothetical protein